MAGGQVGRLSIRVLPDTTQFRNDLRKAITRVEKSVKATIDVELNVTKASLANVKRQLQGLEATVPVAAELARSSKKKVQDQLDGMDATATVNTDLDHGAATAKMAAFTRPRTLPVNVNVTKASLAKATAALAALSGARVLSNFGRNVKNAIANLDRALPAFAAASTALTSLSAAALAGTSNLLGIGAGLASIAPAALALPGLFAGFGVGVGVMVAALKDAGKYLGDLGPKFGAIQDKISGNFWAKAAQPIRDLANNALPMLSDRLAEVGAQLGSFFASMANALNTPTNLGFINGILVNVRDSIDIAAEGIANFTDGLLNLTNAGSAYLPQLASWFNRISESFNEWVQTNTDNGELFTWIDSGVAALQDLGSVLANTGGILAGFATAAANAGGASLGALADGLANVNTAVNGPAFQGALTTVFKGAHDAMAALGPGVSALGDSFVALAPTLAQIMTLAGQIGSVALTAISSAFQNPAFQGGLVDFFNGVLAGVQAIAPAIPALATAFGAVASFAGTLAGVLGPVLGAAIQGLAPVVTSLMGALSAIAPVLGGVLVSAIQTLAPFIQQVVAAISTWVQQNPGFAAGLAAVAVAVGGLVAGAVSLVSALAPVVGAIISLVGPVSSAIAAAGGLSAVMGTVGGAIAAAAAPVALIVGGIAALVASLTHAWATSQKFRDAIAGVAEGIMGVVQPIIGMVVPVVQQLAAGFMSLVSQIQAGLIPVWTGLAEVIGALLERAKPVVDLLVSILGPALSTVGGLLQGLMGVIGTLVGGALSALGTALSVIADLISGDFRGAWDGLVQMFTGIGETLQSVVLQFVQIGINLVQGLIQGIMSAAGGVITFFTTWITSVIDSVKSLFGVASPSTIFAEIGGFLIQGLIQGIQAMVGAVVAIFQSIATTIITAVQAIVTGVMTVWQAIVTGTQAILQGVVTVVTSIFTAVRTVITTILTAARAVVTSIITGIVSVIGTVLRGAISVVTTILNAVKAVFTSVLRAAQVIVRSVLVAVVALFRGNLSAARAAVQTALNAIRSVFSTVLNAAKAIVTSVLGAIKSTFSSVLNAARSIVSSVLNGIRSIFSSTLAAARSVVSSGLNAIKSAFSTILAAVISVVTGKAAQVVNKFRDMGNRALAAITGFVGKFTSVGRNIVQGLINGVGGMAGKLYGKLKGLASGALNSAKNALGIHSPSREFKKIGSYTVEGLIQGLEQGESAVKSTVDKLARGVTDVFEKKAAGSKATRVNGLSDHLSTLKKKLSNLSEQAKATRKVVEVVGQTKGRKNSKGQWTVKPKDITRTKKVATAAAKAAAAQMASVKKQIAYTESGLKAARRGDTKGAATAAAKSFFEKNLAASTARLEDLAKKRDAVAKKLKAAQDKLADAVKVRDDYKTSVADNLSGTFELDESAATTSVTDLIAGFKKAASTVATFGKQLASLRKAGLPSGLVDQITQLGAEKGTAVAANLLTASKSQIKSLASSYKKLNSVSDSTAKSLAQGMYGAGVQAAQGLVNGLKSQQKALEKASANLAKTVVTATKKKLQIHSPSRVMAQLGEYTGAGMVKGLESSARSVNRSMTALVSPPSASAFGWDSQRAGRASTSTTNLTVNVGQTDDGNRIGRRIVETLDLADLAASVS
ncbi:hypothetical protein Bra3105_17700 [Brachybacterium halotolerans subsp. kimchii]|uniref:phage tail protein n=1 Tax=Brachybacterium halotolerans TaxID=2795215 RepID=UPI001E4860C2|nr:hypothetical protein [Brachybacterium halotolerans]UEJ82639.1 hypothetical protein Bra3105_17700 [Brachybacterium halotolerans subsp. kimchii]